MADRVGAPAGGAKGFQRKLARDIHSIKGIAGCYGLELISVAVHRMEDDLAIQDLLNGTSIVQWISCSNTRTG